MDKTKLVNFIENWQKTNSFNKNKENFMKAIQETMTMADIGSYKKGKMFSNWDDDEDRENIKKEKVNEYLKKIKEQDVSDIKVKTDSSLLNVTVPIFDENFMKVTGKEESRVIDLMSSKDLGAIKITLDDMDKVKKADKSRWIELVPKDYIFAEKSVLTNKSNYVKIFRKFGENKEYIIGKSNIPNIINAIYKVPHKDVKIYKTPAGLHFINMIPVNLDSAAYLNLGNKKYNIIMLKIKGSEKLFIFPMSINNMGLLFKI